MAEEINHRFGSSKEKGGLKITDLYFVQIIWFL